MPATSRSAPTALTPMTIAGAISVGISLVGKDSSVDDCAAIYVSAFLIADRVLTSKRYRFPVPPDCEGGNDKSRYHTSSFLLVAGLSTVRPKGFEPPTF